MYKNLKILASFFMLILGFFALSPSQALATNTLTTIGGWNAYVHLPDDYGITGSQTYPAIIHIPGFDAVGTDPSLLITKGGPSAYIQQGWDGSVVVDGTTHKFIVISLQPTSAWPRPVTLKPKIDLIKSTYRIDPNKVNLTGLSMGGWAANIYATYQPTANNYSYGDSIASVTNVIGVVPSDTYDATAPYPARFGIYATRGGKEIGFEQSQDGRDIATIINAMNSAVPSSATYTQTSYGGGAHCCAEQFFGGLGVTPPTYTINGISQTIYQWIARQSRSGPIQTNLPPTSNAGTDQSITLPTSSVTLSGSGTDSDGTIASYAWTKVSGSGTITSSSSASTTVTGLTAGTSVFQLQVTDNQGATGTDTINILVNPASGGGLSPYGGTPRTIPGTIQAEDFDNGGQGVAYNDTNTTNSGGGYRTTEGVDIETTNDSGGGYNVGYGVTGEWQKYTVNVTSTGTYTFGARVATPFSGTRSLQMSIDGVTLATITIPTTGGYQTYQTISVSNISLSSGQHVMRIYNSAEGYNVNYYTFTLIGGASNTPPTSNAGVDQSITLPTSSVTLTGSGSDSDGTIASYAWTKVSGSGTITSATSASTTVTGLTAGTSVFQLQVTDNQGATATDTVSILINPAVVSGTAKKIVILGSSTAYGTGASPISNSWVNLFTNYILANNSQSQVINLGTPSQNTYNLLPTGSSYPANQPSWAPDPARNITQAISQNPNAIIINMPSNDAAINMAIATQQANWNTIASAASQAGIPLYVTTTQPRGTLSPQERIDHLVFMRDWLTGTYGARAIDFWTTVADPDNRINAAYDFGDQIHVNNAGHSLFYNRVISNSNLLSLLGTSGTSNIAPVANAGVDQSITLPTSSGTLAGSGTDSDGTIASYSWTKLSGSGTITTSTSASTTVTGLTAGTSVFRLTVTDNLGATGTDDVLITTNPATGITPKTFLIDFGSQYSPTNTSGWNDIIDPRTGTTLALKDSTNATTTASLQITNGFVVKTATPTASANINGTTASGIYPANATSDSLYLTPNAPGGSVSDTLAQLVVSGLNTSSTYTITFYASRMAGDTTNRTMRYTIGSQSVTLNATDNVSNTVQIGSVPATTGSVTIDMSLVGSYGYIGVLKIVEN